MAVLPETSRPRLSVVRAWTCLGINLFATPGLGSILGGRKLIGRGQLFFAVIGFCLIVLWIFKFDVNLVQAQINETTSTGAPAWLWRGGALAFGIGWLWSFVTSISLVVQATQEERKVPPKLPRVAKSVPPKLS